VLFRGGADLATFASSSAFESNRSINNVNEPSEWPSSTTPSIATTGGVYNSQGRNQRWLITNSYKQFLVSESMYCQQSHLRTRIHGYPKSPFGQGLKQTNLVNVPLYSACGLGYLGASQTYIGPPVIQALFGNLAVHCKFQFGKTPVAVTLANQAINTFENVRERERQLRRDETLHKVESVSVQGEPSTESNFHTDCGAYSEGLARYRNEADRSTHELGVAMHHPSFT